MMALSNLLSMCAGLLCILTPLCTLQYMLLFAFLDNKVHRDSCASCLLLEPQVVFKSAPKKRKSNIDIFSTTKYSALLCMNDLQFLDSNISFLVLTISLHLRLLNNVVLLMNQRTEICCPGAVRGAWREDSGDVCLRL